MELYIPPPTAFLPRLPPPRPIVPAVPLVPPPDLPDVLHAPEGSYTIDNSLFPSIGSPAPPPVFETRPTMPHAGTFMGAGGFIVPGPPPPGAGQTAMSYGSSMVNGQHQPGYPVRMSFVNVWFPSKIGNENKGLGGMFGIGGSGGGTKGENAGQNTAPPAQNMSGYEPSISSEDSSPPSSDMPPMVAMEVPAGALPAQQAKRMPFSKGTTPGQLPRPKTSLRSSNSTFVTRLQALDALPKMMAEKGRNGPEMARWGFWNLGRTFGWGEQGAGMKDALARVTFSQVPTCHCISPHTASYDRIDIIVGFASGDLVWIDFILGRYTRINKGGILNDQPVIAVQFDPRQPQHFIAAFADSTVVQFNLFGEDPLPIVQSTAYPWTTYFEENDDVVELDVDKRAAYGASSSGGGAAGGTSAAGAHSHQGEIKEEVHEEVMITWRNEDWAVQLTEKEKKMENRNPWAGKNPCAVTKVGKKPITGLAYSPDGRTLAIISEDGMVRLLDTIENSLTDVFAGYFSALNCLCWSPDGRFLAVGGQDDLITIFSPRESRVVARCQGHSAFVSHIAFDVLRGEGRGGYRFGSVGEDGKLILWDFTAAQLHRPRHHHSNNSHHRIAGSTVSLGGQPSQPGASSRGGTFHPSPPRSEVALLQPVLARVVEGNLLTGVYFSHTAILTVSRAAQLKWWQRPKRQKSKSAMNAAAKRSNTTNGLSGMIQPSTPGLKSPREGIMA